MHGVILSTHQPRVDQMVQSIERTNSINSMQSVQRIDTRLSDISAAQAPRLSSDTKSQRVGGLLVAARGKAELPSPLRPARSWS
jgi:hypothetical protein